MTASLYRPDRAPECTNGNNHRFSLYTQNAPGKRYRIISLITCKTRKSAQLFFRERLTSPQNTIRPVN